MRYLVIAHGSKHSAHAEAFNDLMNGLKALAPDKNIHHCFLNYARPLAEDKLKELSAESNETISIIPVFLGKAKHMLEDIPEIIEDFKEKYPNIPLYLSAALGTANELQLGLEAQLQSIMNSKSFDLEDTQLILLGRGSSIVKSTMFIHDLKETLNLNFNDIKVGFWDVASPSLEECLEEYRKSDISNLIIQPLFLFPGVLNDKLKEVIQKNQNEFPHKTFAISTTLSQWECMPKLILERMNSAAQI